MVSRVACPNYLMRFTAYGCIDQATMTIGSIQDMDFLVPRFGQGGRVRLCHYGLGGPARFVVSR